MCVYSAKVGAEIGSRRNIFLDYPSLSPSFSFSTTLALAFLSQRESFSYVHTRASVFSSVRTRIRCVLRATKRGTEVLRELFMSGGYAEHSKVPPKITGALAHQRANLNVKFAFCQAGQNAYCDKKKKKVERRIGERTNGAERNEL